MVDGAGIQYVSLVDKPAIQRNFLAFNEGGKSIQFKSIEERVLTGPLLIPDQPVFRNDEQFGKHYVMYTKEAIKKVALKFFRDHNADKVNLMHAIPVEDVYLFESFFINKERGIATPKGFAEAPDGSWFVSYKVDNESVWQDFIKTGEFKGFSIEGFFTYVKNDQLEEDFLSAISKILND